MQLALNIDKPLTSKLFAQSGWVFKAALLLIGTILIALAAQIQVPLQPVPVTLQDLAVLFIAMIYGWRIGAITVAAYIFEGLLGAPVFAGMQFGLATLLGPKGGYIIGFLLAALIAGSLVECGWGRYRLTTAVASLLGFTAVFAVGTIQLASYVGFHEAMALGVMPFLFGNALKLVFLAVVVPSFWQPQQNNIQSKS